MSISQLDTLYESAVVAMDSADWNTAVLKLMAVKARLATTPNLSRGIGGGGNSSITWNAAEIDSLIGQCRQMQAASAHATSGPLQQTKVTYARVDSPDE